MSTEDQTTWNADVVAKFERAQKLRNELAETQGRSREGIEFDYDWVNNFDDHSDPVAWQEWRLKKIPPRPPLEFSAVLGDLVRNLRATLDYCAWEAADEQARASNPTQVFFPLHAKQRDWTQWRKKHAGWYSPAALAVFENPQPWLAPPELLHPLAILQTLSNTDKHRLLNTARYGFVHHNLTIEPEPQSHSFDAVDLVPETDGSVVARLEMARPAGAGSFEVRVEFGWYECFKYEPKGGPARWLLVNEMVDEMYRHTLATVAAMQTAVPATD